MNDPQQLGDRLWQFYCGDPWYGPCLTRALEGVDFTMAGVKPLVGCHSIWEIVLHMDAWQRVCTQRLRGLKCPAPEHDFPTPVEFSAACWEADLKKLRESTEACVRCITGIDMLDRSKSVPGFDYTLLALAHAVADHMVYHAGQISLLKKASAQTS